MRHLYLSRQGGRKEEEDEEEEGMDLSMKSNNPTLKSGGRVKIVSCKEVSQVIEKTLTGIKLLHAYYAMCAVFGDAQSHFISDAIGFNTVEI